MGRCHADDAFMEIDPSAPGAVAKVTLWHEVIHAMLFGGGINTHDEIIVDLLAHKIVEALQRNPELREMF